MSIITDGFLFWADAPLVRVLSSTVVRGEADRKAHGHRLYILYTHDTQVAPLATSRTTRLVRIT